MRSVGCDDSYVDEESKGVREEDSESADFIRIDPEHSDSIKKCAELMQKQENIKETFKQNLSSCQQEFGDGFSNATIEAFSEKLLISPAENSSLEEIQIYCSSSMEKVSLIASEKTDIMQIDSSAV